MAASERRLPLRAAALALLLAAPVYALDLGRVGPVWPVAEPDLLALIQSRLEGEAEKRRTGPHPGRVRSPFARTHGVARAGGGPGPDPHATQLPSLIPRSPLPDSGAGPGGQRSGGRRHPGQSPGLRLPVPPLIFFDARDREQTRTPWPCASATVAGRT